MQMQPELRHFLLNSRALNELPNRFIVHRHKEPLSLSNPAIPGPHALPENQLPLHDAIITCERIGGSGIGFSVPENYVIVDFDSAVNSEGELEAWALAILSKIPDTLVEFSPSGHGLHAYLKLTNAAHTFIMETDKATSIAAGKIEFLRQGFYSTITGNRHHGYSDKIAELDALSAQQLVDRIKQTARSLPSVVPVETFDAAIHTATEEDIAKWRHQITSGAALHQPTFMYAWWSAYNYRDKQETEEEIHELYNQCEIKDGRWEDRRRKINTIVARCFRKAIEYHKKVEERRVAMAQLTEEGNARYVSLNNPDNMIYTTALGWMIYSGKVYESIDEYQTRERMFQIYMKGLADLYANTQENKIATQIHKHSQACRTNKVRTAIEVMARGFMTGEYNEFDQDTTVLNCQNGVVDLQTGMMFHHDPTFRMVNLANVAYREQSQAPTPYFDKFMNEFTCFDADLKEYLLCCVGYSLTGETLEQKFFVLYGEGGNGKTTLTNLIRDLIGIPTRSMDGTSLRYKRYFATLRSEALLSGEKGGGEVGNDLAAVSKARFVLASEIGDRKIKDERLKAMVGGDTMQVRFLFREYFEIVPRFKLWLQTNQRPRVRGNDEGIWRRAVMLPCLGDFRANPDRHLGDKLFSEREAIFHKLVQYSIKWYRDKLPDPPKVVTNETASWREETDAVARFIHEKVERIEGYKTSNNEIWQAWSKWCTDNNERPGTSNDFYKRLRGAGWEPQKLHIKGSSQRGYEHMRIVDIDGDGDDVEF